MTNQQIANEIIKHAMEYRDNLENKNVLFIFQNRSDKSIDAMETVYKARNFLHLTGVEVNTKKVKSSIRFYELATSGRLTESHFSVRGRVEDKLDALGQTMAIHQTGREIGDFYGTTGNLRTEKLSGTTYACLGFVLGATMYEPNTNLIGNVRLFAPNSSPILATLRKNIGDKKYTEITHVKKGLDFSTVKLPDEILSKLSDEAKTELKQPLSAPEKNTAEKSPTVEDFTVTRHIGGTFMVTLGDVSRKYELLRGAEKEAEVANAISKDFGCAFEVGEELFNRAAEQNVVEQEAGKSQNAPEPQELIKDEKETEILT